MPIWKFAHLSLFLVIGIIGIFTIPQAAFAAPPTPDGFAQTGSTDTSIQVKWNPVSDATFFRIGIKKRVDLNDPNSDYRSESVDIKDAKATTGGVSALTKNTVYPMWISACSINERGEEECSKPTTPEISANTSNQSATTTTTATSPTQTSGTLIDNTNYRAPQNADYTIYNLQHAILCSLAGSSPLDKCVGIKKDANNKPILSLYNQLPSGGAIGGLASISDALYNPPTSTAYYLASVANGFGIINPTYAQVTGSGAGLIAPVEKLWQAMRNIAYILYIIVFMVIGFMIMFRQKLNPQTVISVQSALPSLVIGLLLVTFSYFIAAIFIDLAFIAIPITTQVFAQSGAANIFGSTSGQFQDLANQSNVFHLFFHSGVNSAQSFGTIREGVIGVAGSFTGGEGGLRLSLGTVIAALVASITGGPFGLALGAGAIVGGALGPEIISLVIVLILIIALIVQFFKLLFKLLNSYALILINTVLGPLLIVAGSIPGKGGGISHWWKNVLGHALVFPAVFATFLFAGAILGSVDPWTSTPPLFGGLNTELVKILVGYVIILGTTAVPDIVKKLVGAQDAGEIGKAGIAAFSGGFGIGVNGANKGYQRTLGRYVEGSKKWQEARRNYELGMDRYQDTGNIKAKRIQAASGPGLGSWVNRQANRFFYRGLDRPLTYEETKSDGSRVRVSYDNDGQKRETPIP